MQRLPLKRTDDECSGETFADTRRLCQVKVTAASPGNRQQSFEFFLVRLPE